MSSYKITQYLEVQNYFIWYEPLEEIGSVEILNRNSIDADNKHKICTHQLRNILVLIETLKIFRVGRPNPKPRATKVIYSDVLEAIRNGKQIKRNINFVQVIITSDKTPYRAQ